MPPAIVVERPVSRDASAPDADAKIDPARVGVLPTTAADKPTHVTVADAWVTSGHDWWPRGDVANLLDSDKATKWCMPTKDTWPIVAQLELPRGTESSLRRYTLIAADDVPKRDPKSWVLQGSADGRTWSDIDVREDRPVMERFGTATFDAKETKYSKKYRLLVRSNHGDAGFQLSGIELSGVVRTFAVAEEVDRFGEPLPLPTDEDVTAAQPIPAVKTTLWNRDGEWSFRGIVGPLGVMAQRSKQKKGVPPRYRRREYRVLSIEKGSPSYGRLLPGDVIVGVDGNRFKPGTYANKAAAKFKSYREPNWEMGRAIEKAYEKNGGLLKLTVRRGDRKGVVDVQLEDRPGFAPTYPWNCPQSRELCRQIAQNYSKELHGTGRLEPWRAAWYGLFLLNYDPSTYRAAIDDIVRDVRTKLKERALAGIVRGIWAGNNNWKMAAEAIFLAEYSMMTGKSAELRNDLDRYVQLLFGTRMLGNLWGHGDNVNYGYMRGGFMGASAQVSLALLCLKKAGATVSQTELDKVLDSISASIDKRNGHVSYASPGDARALLPFDWQHIDEDTSQVASESIMRQAAVHLAMRFAGRMTEAEATYRFMRRQTVVFATHGMTQDAGVFEGARALASCNPADCRALLDSYLPRLNMSLRWDGGVHLIPSGRDPSGKDEYSAYRERGIELYMPAVMGLLLSMPEKRLFLFNNVLSPGDAPVAWPPRKPRQAVNACSVRNLTYHDDSAYYVTYDASRPLRWAVYRHRFTDRNVGGRTTAIIGDLAESPYELVVWRSKLLVSGAGKEGAVMVWDIARGGRHRTLNTYNHSRSSQFTEYDDALYYISPQPRVGGANRYVGGQLWRTRDGVTAERVDILPDGKPLWGLLHGCASWQTILANARSLQVVDLGVGKRLFCQTAECTGNSAAWAKPVHGGQTLWVTDASPGKARPFYRRPKKSERWPGSLRALAVDSNNSRVGSLIGFGYGGRLYFSKDDRLFVSDREGATFTALEIAGRTFRSPNNFTTIACAGKMLFAFSAQMPKAGRKIVLTDGTRLIAELGANGDNGFDDVRHLTSVGESLYFVGITREHGAELWHTDGTTDGTSMVRDLRPGPESTIIDNLVARDGRIYFAAWHDRYGTELWRHDPKTSRLMVADIVPGRASARPQQMRAYGRWLVFALDTRIDGSAVLRYADGTRHNRISFKLAP
jgi:ELWxxDGT repeat protein